MKVPAGTWRRAQGRSRKHWRDYGCNLAWERLRIPEDVAEEKDMWAALLIFQTDPDKGLKMDVWLDNVGL